MPISFHDATRSAPKCQAVGSNHIPLRSTLFTEPTLSPFIINYHETGLDLNPVIYWAELLSYDSNKSAAGLCP